MWLLKAGKYPFMVDPQSYLSRIIPGRPLEILARDRDYIELARARLVAALLGGGDWRPEGLTSEDEVASFYLALAAAGKASKLALSKFIDAELERARRLMEEEEEDSLFEVAWRMGLRIERRIIRMPWLVDDAGRVMYRSLNMAVRVDDVLRATAGVASLANMFLKDGWVYLDRGGLIELLLGAARRRLYGLVEELSGVDSEGLEELAFQVRVAVEEASIDEIGFIGEAVPECIKELLEKAESRGLSEEELYVLATFLANTNAPARVLAGILASSGLAVGELANVIAEVMIVKAKEFKPYNCRELLSRGICSKCPKGGLLEGYKANVKRMVLERGLSPRRTA